MKLLTNEMCRSKKRTERLTSGKRNEKRFGIDSDSCVERHPDLQRSDNCSAAVILQSFVESAMLLWTEAITIQQVCEAWSAWLEGEKENAVLSSLLEKERRGLFPPNAMLLCRGCGGTYRLWLSSIRRYEVPARNHARSRYVRASPLTAKQHVVLVQHHEEFRRLDDILINLHVI